MRYAVIDQVTPGASPANVVAVVDVASGGALPAVRPGQGLVADPPDGVAAGWVLVGGRFCPSIPARTVFDPLALITTLFTPAEQIGFTSKPKGVLFMGLIAAAPSVDLTSPTFRAYLAQAVLDGFLTQDRADQVLAGKPAPQAT